MNANNSHDANAVARDNAVACDVDITIDRALSALRDAQPRSGLENRILTSLEHRNTAPQPARFHISAHLALWAATSAAVLAIASLIILHRQTTPTRTVALSANSGAVILSGGRSPESKNPDTGRRATNPEPFSTTNLAQTTDTPSSRPNSIGRHPERSVAQRRISVFEDAQITSQPNGESTTPTDAQALADLHAPSHPAPPLPLTPQEKLLLRTLRYGNLTELAELNPEVRARQAADETAAFKAFFPDPPPLQQPGDTE